MLSSYAAPRPALTGGLVFLLSVFQGHVLTRSNGCELCTLVFSRARPRVVSAPQRAVCARCPVQSHGRPQRAGGGGEPAASPAL